MYGQGATPSSSGAKRPTASAPAVAVSAVRHHASQVRSAAIEVRCHTSTCTAVGAGGGSAGLVIGSRGDGERAHQRLLVDIVVEALVAHEQRGQPVHSRR